MESIGEEPLGPVRAELGRFRAADWPGMLTALLVIAVVVGIALVILGLVFIGGWLFSDSAEGIRGVGDAVIGLGIGGLLLFGGIAVVLAVILRLVMTRRLNVTIHEGGLVIDRSWFRRIQIAWSQITTISPPEPGGTTIGPRCVLVLRSGRTIPVERLSLPSLRNHMGHVIPHQDVRLVIDSFVQWQRTHGRGWHDQG